MVRHRFDSVPFHVATGLNGRQKVATGMESPRVCPTCGNEFAVLRTNGTPKVYCSKHCRQRASDSRRHPRDRKEYQRWRHVQNKYGMTKEQFDEMFKAQGERCAACGSKEPGSTYGWHIDHDHRLNIVRGILCVSCNTSLPDVDDQLDRLLGLVDYIRRFQKSVMIIE